jgi:dihydroorotase
MDSVSVLKPDDMHVHLRQGEPAAGYLKDLSRFAGRAVVMPNTEPPVISLKRFGEYRKEILALRDAQGLDFEPLFTFQVNDGLDRPALNSLKDAGAVCGKYYPKGVTTNSEEGVSDIRSVYPVFAAMEKLGIVLSIHGELPGVPVMERETAFLPVFLELTADFPDLKIVLEHISTREAAEAVSSRGPNIAATITAHHLLASFEDLAGGSFEPSLFCKPVLKSPEHQAALREAALSGPDRFFFGSDSAPHPKETKASLSVPAGVYAAPSALPAVFGFFVSRLGARKGSLLFEEFCSRRGASFYGLPEVRERVVFVRKPWRVPESSAGCVPFLHGRELAWTAEG